MSNRSIYTAFLCLGLTNLTQAGDPWEVISNEEKYQMVHVPEADRFERRRVEEAMIGTLLKMLEATNKKVAIGIFFDALSVQLKTFRSDFGKITGNEEKEDFLQGWLKTLTNNWDAKKRSVVAYWFRTCMEKAAVPRRKELSPLIRGFDQLAVALEEWVDKEAVARKRRQGGTTDEKEHLFMATPEEFSGAVEGAHKKGIKGKGSKIIVLEDINEEMAAFSEKRMRTEGSSGDLEDTEHGNAVITRILGIAPEAQCLVKSDELLIFQEQYLEDPALKDIKIVNASFSWEKSSKSSNLKKSEKIKRFSQNKLIIKSFGNEHGRPDEYKKLLNDLYADKDFLKNALLVVNIDRNSQVADSSNRPKDAWEYADTLWTEEQKRQLMDNTMSALGTGVFGFIGLGEIEKSSGTSFSGPPFAGGLALVESMGKKEGVDLSAQELKGIALKSARKEAFIPGDDGHKGIFIVANDMPEEEFKRLQKAAPAGVVYERFDPALYGCGFLDIRRMTVFAEAYIAQKKQDLGFVEKRVEAIIKKRLESAERTMIAWDKKTSVESAGKIKQAYREWKARKKRKFRSFIETGEMQKVQELYHLKRMNQSPIKREEVQ